MNKKEFETWVNNNCTNQINLCAPAIRGYHAGANAVYEIMKIENDKLRKHFDNCKADKIEDATLIVAAPNLLNMLETAECLLTELNKRQENVAITVLLEPIREAINNAKGE